MLFKELLFLKLKGADSILGPFANRHAKRVETLQQSRVDIRASLKSENHTVCGH